MPGLLSRLFAKPAPEQRRSIASVPGWGIGGIYAGSGSYNAHIAEGLAVVTACINAVASSLASLPAVVYRVEDAGRTEAPNHPVARLIRAPNEFQTWPDWIEQTIGSVLLHGNAVSIIETDNAGRPVRLVPIPWHALLVTMLPTGKLAYDLQPTTTWYGIPVAPGRYFADQVFHLRDRSDTGPIGRSRLSRCPQLLDAAVSLGMFSAALWRNGSSPAGFLKHPGHLSKEAKEYITASYAEAFGGPINARKTPLLEEGLTWEAGAPTPEDSQLLESRRLMTEELCRLMQVPPPIVQDYTHNTFTNSQQADQWFARHSLLPWARKLEAEFSRSVFTDPTFHMEIDFSAMVRGSYSERWATGLAAVQAGVVTRDELRAEEGYPPMATADEAPAGEP